MDIHKTFLHHKENSPWRHALIGIFFEKVGGIYEFSKNGVISVIVYSFFPNWRINQHHYYRELRTTESELHLNYPQLRLLSLVWGVNLTSPSLVRNYFYALAIRNAYSFRKLPNNHFSGIFYK